MTAYDWLSSVIEFELLADEMSESDKLDREEELTCFMEALSDTEQETASAIYYFWMMNETGEIGES